MCFDNRSGIHRRKFSEICLGTETREDLFSQEKCIVLPGTNKFAQLSIAVDFPNVGGHLDTWNIEILGPVVLKVLAKARLKGEMIDNFLLSGFEEQDMMRLALMLIFWFLGD
ncbi:beta-galactosidase 3-like [Silene latifolia]|uniref:beta-galactosidase 3-like n=1 Tax=Silene latifolia TaxID=37657 RepID=UPI003D774C3D